MARVIADRMHGAGIQDVLVVGGSADVAATLGLPYLADEYRDEGPLCGLITALRAVSTEILCVLPCDVPQITSLRIKQLAETVTSIGPHDAAVLTSIREHWLCSSWRVRTCLPMLERRFAEGERAIHRVVKDLVVTRVSASESEMTNFNTLQQALGGGPISESGD